MNFENFKTFLRDLGLLLHVPAILFVPLFVVIFVYKEWFALPSFLIMAIVSFLIGQILYQGFKKSHKSYEPLSLPLVALSWFLIPLIGTIPYVGVSIVEGVEIGEAIRFTDFSTAFFEAMSGFTSTGLSMLDNPGTIPRSLQFWRSLSEWIGGLGVIFLAVVLFELNSETKALYEAEAMSWTIPEKNVRKTMISIWSIYLIFTILAIFAFYFAGMPLWEAINHGLTAVCTGGFTITSDSFISYNSSIKIIAIVIMLIGALSFRIHYLLVFKRNIISIIKLTEMKFFALAFIVFLVIAFFFKTSTAEIDVLFQVASALGTCGFNSVETPNMMLAFIFLLNIAMIMGGNSSSTTGGVKSNRIIWILKGMKNTIISYIRRPVKGEKYYYFNGEKIEEDEGNEKIANSSFIIILWIFAICIGVIIVYLVEGEKHALHQTLFDVTSALGNVGLSAGYSGFEMNVISKWVFIILMWIGRLEIFAVIMLLFAPFLFKSIKKD